MADTQREMIQVIKVDQSRLPKKLGIQDERNRWFGIFDAKLYPRFTEGASLNVEWTIGGDQGQYKNIVSVLGTAATPNGATSRPDAREGRIMREVALKAAVDYHAPSRGGSETVEDVLTTAGTFLLWLQGDEDQEPF